MTSLGLWGLFCLLLRVEKLAELTLDSTESPHFGQKLSQVHGRLGVCTKNVKSAFFFFYFRIY